MPNELKTIYHVVFGLLAVASAVWTAVEVMNICEKNKKRAGVASLAVTLFSWLTFILGGIGYVKHYAADKAVIKAGPWPWAQTVVMEVKEHAFFLLLMLSIYLPIVVFNSKLLENKGLKKLAVTSALMIAVIGLGMQVFGEIIVKAVKMGLLGVK
jgi:hypothetical protein